MKPLSETVPPDESSSLQKSVVHRRVEITVEREVLTVVSQPAAGIAGWCQRCGRNVWMLSPEAAAARHGVSIQEIHRRLDEKQLHFQERESGAILVCSESLKWATAKELP